MLITNIAKAETVDRQPRFLEKYEADNTSSSFEALRQQGYRFCMGVRPGRRITVGSMWLEWRQLGTVIFFFKDEIPEDMLERLRVGKRNLNLKEIPTVEYRKFYSQMSSVGRSWYKAALTPRDVKQWINFFEATSAQFCGIDVLVDQGRFPWKD